MSRTERTAKHRGSRTALGRVMGAAMLALFVHQSTAVARTSCDARGADPESAAMAEMGHEQHGAGSADVPRAPNSPAGPSAPAPNHGLGCDHTLPANVCGIGVGCGVAVASPVIVASAQRARVSGAFVSAADGSLPLEFAPDTPPPRA